MSVRAAKFEDIPAVAAIMRKAFYRSAYAEIATFDDIQAKQLCARSMQRHGQKNYGGTLFLVADGDSGVVGFIIAMVDLVYPTVVEYTVTDLMFIVDEGASPKDAPEMLRQVIAWAESNPKVIEVHLGVTDAVGSDWERVGKLYGRQGLEQCGGMFRKIIPRGAQQEASA